MIDVKVRKKEESLKCKMQALTNKIISEIDYSSHTGSVTIEIYCVSGNIKDADYTFKTKGVFSRGIIKK